MRRWSCSDGDVELETELKSRPRQRLSCFVEWSSRSRLSGGGRSVFERQNKAGRVVGCEHGGGSLVVRTKDGQAEGVIDLW